MVDARQKKRNITYASCVQNNVHQNATWVSLPPTWSIVIAEVGLQHRSSTLLLIHKSRDFDLTTCSCYGFISGFFTPVLAAIKSCSTLLSPQYVLCTLKFWSWFPQSLFYLVLKAGHAHAQLVSRWALSIVFPFSPKMCYERTRKKSDF